MLLTVHYILAVIIYIGLRHVSERNVKKGGDIMAKPAFGGSLLPTLYQDGYNVVSDDFTRRVSYPIKWFQGTLKRKRKD